MATKKEKGKKDGATTLAAVLPGESELAGGLIDQAVQDLNRIYVTKGLETARAIGDYVLATFFGGDAASFRKRGNGHVSFRELDKRADLRVGWQFIWNAVAVVEQMPLLPIEVSEALPLSHHKLLLGVKNPEQKVSLARAAVTERMGKRDLEQKVKAVRTADAGKSKAGRPVLPAFVKAFTVLKRAAEIAESGSVTDASFEHYGKDEAKKLLAEVDLQIEVLAAVAARVRGYLEE